MSFPVCSNEAKCQGKELHPGVGVDGKLVLDQEISLGPSVFSGWGPVTSQGEL